MARFISAGAYSFADCNCSIKGPGNLNASTTGEAEEGYSIEFEGDKDTMVAGAGGAVMHSLRVAQPGRLMLRLWKTSAFNKIMADAYNYQTASAATHGRMVIIIDDFVRGDRIECFAAAFVRHPNINFGIQGGTQEWTFNCGYISPRLGAGVDQALIAATQ